MNVVEESQRAVALTLPSFNDTETDEDIEQEELRIAQLARDMRLGKVPTISLEELEVKLGLDAIPENPDILDEIQ